MPTSSGAPISTGCSSAGSDAEADGLLDGIFADGAHAMVEAEEEWHWSLGATTTAVGMVTVTYRSMRIDDATSMRRTTGAGTTLILHPDKLVAAGSVQVHEDVDALFGHLDSLSSTGVGDTGAGGVTGAGRPG